MMVASHCGKKYSTESVYVNERDEFHLLLAKIGNNADESVTITLLYIKIVLFTYHCYFICFKNQL